MTEEDGRLDGRSESADDQELETGEVLLHESSPDDTVHAVVEQDDRVAYFYLHSQRPWMRMKSCWIRNLIPGPAALDPQEMSAGLAPRLPRTACNHPRGAQPLSADSLEVVWFEASDGAALRCDGELLAVIPPWSGEGGFAGYARDCREETIVAWPLPNHPALFERIEQASQWWKAWQQGGMWSSIQRQLLASYEAYIGKHDKYYSIDGGHWPPKALASFPLPKSWGNSLELVASLGVSIRPQPMVERFTDEPHMLERIELGAIATPESRMAAAQWISGAANHPWHHGTWIGAGHTMERPTTDQQDERRKIALVPHNRLPEPISLATLAEVREAPVNLLIAIPITDSQWQQFNLTGVDGLLATLTSHEQFAW